MDCPICKNVGVINEAKLINVDATSSCWNNYNGKVIWNYICNNDHGFNVDIHSPLFQSTGERKEMNIIRDEKMGNLKIAAILIDTGVHWCGMLGCINKSNTILIQIASRLPVAYVCEEHYQKVKEEGRINYFLYGR